MPCCILLRSLLVMLVFVRVVVVLVVFMFAFLVFVFVFVLLALMFMLVFVFVFVLVFVLALAFMPATALLSAMVFVSVFAAPTIDCSPVPLARPPAPVHFLRRILAMCQPLRRRLHGRRLSQAVALALGWRHGRGRRCRDGQWHA